jgi:HTH-type transcriptional regulator/antitoxin HipB
MKYTSEQIGKIVKQARRNLGVTQRSLAMTSGTGLRFIIELERGKDTCQLGKVLTVINTLGVIINLTPPAQNPSAEKLLKDPVNERRSAREQKT